MNKQDFSIVGLTCAHCVSAVTEEVTAALDEAGDYSLAGPRGLPLA